MVDYTLRTHEPKSSSPPLNGSARFFVTTRQLTDPEQALNLSDTIWLQNSRYLRELYLYHLMGVDSSSMMEELMLSGNVAHSRSQNLDSNSSEPISIMATLGTVHLSPATEESMTILKTHPLSVP